MKRSGYPLWKNIVRKICIEIKIKLRKKEAFEKLWILV